MGRGLTLGNMPDAVAKKPITQRWWFPTVVVVAVLLALASAQGLGLLDWIGSLIDSAQQGSCDMADATGPRPDFCP